MNYSKPAVNTLGEAKNVIERLQTKPVPGTVDQGIKQVFNPAYDLDE